MMTAQIIETVRRHVGRRHRITRDEMTAILQDLVDQGLDPRNGHFGRTLDTSAQWQAPTESTRFCLPPSPNAAQAWTEACRDITCISVMGEDAQDMQGDGAVRYDQPGSMHPMQRASLTFAPDWMPGGTGNHDYLRRHCSRLLLLVPQEESR